jgi:hypothetical protein
MPSSAQELASYGGFTDIKGEKTGFFDTEKIDGRWRLVTPKGNSFGGMGIARKDSPGRMHLLGTLEIRYQGDIEKLNRAYKTSFTSFEELEKSGSRAYPAWMRNYSRGYTPMPKVPFNYSTNLK